MGPTATHQHILEAVLGGDVDADIDRGQLISDIADDLAEGRPPERSVDLADHHIVQHIDVREVELEGQVHPANDELGPLLDDHPLVLRTFEVLLHSCSICEGLGTLNCRSGDIAETILRPQ